MKNFMNKLAVKATITKNAIAEKFSEKIKENDGMEVVQVLIIVIVSITLGALLLTTLKTQFAVQLTKVASEMNGMFS
ncbi:MAG: hypothetical protein RSE07_01850 [Oscillospiraceae bacterium]